eukprot:scaffold51374_cov30-Tisochrysis_lutea.AAC.3
MAYGTALGVGGSSISLSHGVSIYATPDKKHHTPFHAESSLHSSLVASMEGSTHRQQHENP